MGVSVWACHCGCVGASESESVWLCQYGRQCSCVSVGGCQCLHVSVGDPPDTPTQTHSSDTHTDIHTQTRPHRHIHLTYIRTLCQCVCQYGCVSVGVSV